MGCCDSRGGLQNEEIALRSQESVLLFENQSVTANYLALCRYSRGQMLNADGFNEALDKMLVLKTNLGSSNTVRDFYNSFCGESGTYDAKLLKVLCVLLSVGTPEEKAEILFEVYDPGFHLLLDKSLAAQLASDLVEVSTKKVQILVTDSQWKQSGQLATKEYIDRLLHEQGKAEDSLKQTLLCGKSVVSKEEFICRMAKAEDGNWLSTIGVRKILSTFAAERCVVRKHPKVSLMRARPQIAIQATGPNP